MIPLILRPNKFAFFCVLLVYRLKSSEMYLQLLIVSFKYSSSFPVHYIQIKYRTFFSKTSRPALRPTQSPLQVELKALFQGVNWPWREAVRSPPSCDEVKNACTCFILVFIIHCFCLILIPAIENLAVIVLSLYSRPCKDNIKMDLQEMG